jgi:hypothetical protein
MSRRIVVVAALFAITACEHPTAPTTLLSANLKLASAAGTKTNEWLDISGNQPNTCNGEDTFLSGRVHFVLTESTNGNITTIKLHENFDDLKGVGLTTGDRYHLNAAIKVRVDQTIEATPPFPFTGEEHLTAELVSNGPGDNLKLFAIFTVTFDGTTSTVEIKKLRIECHG